MFMSFDLYSFFRMFVCFLYQVKDSDKCFDDSVLKGFSTASIFSLIIFVRSEIILFSEFLKLTFFHIIIEKHCFKYRQRVGGEHYVLKLGGQRIITERLQFVLW